MNCQILFKSIQRGTSIIISRITSLESSQLITRQFHGLTQTLVTAANGQISGSNVCKNYLLQSVQPILNHTCGLKHKAILKRRCKDCFIYAIEGRWFVGCKTFGRHKQAQIVKKEKNTWMLTSVCQSKKRPWW
ncbi:GSCOCG00001083001-RA-CDS [Cotesia congregata]|nr:GSCOCG00001083001-RA-CDS [Cotesia congregata]